MLSEYAALLAQMQQIRQEMQAETQGLVHLMEQERRGQGAALADTRQLQAALEESVSGLDALTSKALTEASRARRTGLGLLSSAFTHFNDCETAIDSLEVLALGAGRAVEATMRAHLKSQGREALLAARNASKDRELAALRAELDRAQRRIESLQEETADAEAAAAAAAAAMDAAELAAAAAAAAMAREVRGQEERAKAEREKDAAISRATQEMEGVSKELAALGKADTAKKDLIEKLQVGGPT